MPELPDVTVYVEALEQKLAGRRLVRVVLRSSFVLRSVEPPLDTASGTRIAAVSRIGKRIVLHLAEDVRSAQAAPDLFLVIHLMIAGRLRWREAGAKLGLGPKLVLAVLEFEQGALYFTEAGTRKRASLTVVRGAEALASIHRGGLEPLDANLHEFRETLQRENHTLKRALTDPRLFSGIGNAYSDEILHAARLSPLKLTRSLNSDESARLHAATQTTLRDWIARLRARAGGDVPEKVTAFHADMAVHGRYRQPCPACGAPVQHIVYADNECNYCARCQTGGKLLADRSLSRLLKDDWPRSIDEVT